MKSITAIAAVLLASIIAAPSQAGSGGSRGNIVLADAKPRPSRQNPRPPVGITPVESAQYTKDLLTSLHSIAVHQQQDRLAQKLEEAAQEADRIIKEGGANQ